MPAKSCAKGSDCSILWILPLGGEHIVDRYACNGKNVNDRFGSSTGVEHFDMARLGIGQDLLIRRDEKRVEVARSRDNDAIRRISMGIGRKAVAPDRDCDR